ANVKAGAGGGYAFHSYTITALCVGRTSVPRAEGAPTAAPCFSTLQRVLMKLYFSPLTCSLAVRIALYEAGANVDYVRVDTKAKRTETGADYLTIHSVGMVPVLQLDDGQRLTEVSAVLQYVAASYPNAHLGPTDDLGRARLAQWLSFIG